MKYICSVWEDARARCFSQRTITRAQFSDHVVDRLITERERDKLDRFANTEGGGEGEGGGRAFLDTWEHRPVGLTRGLEHCSECKSRFTRSLDRDDTTLLAYRAPWCSLEDVSRRLDARHRVLLRAGNRRNACVAGPRRSNSRSRGSAFPSISRHVATHTNLVRESAGNFYHPLLHSRRGSAKWWMDWRPSRWLPFSARACCRPLLRTAVAWDTGCV